MKTINYYWLSARFLAEAHGLDNALELSAKYSKDAFENDNMEKHLHWKFVHDYLEIPNIIKHISKDGKNTLEHLFHDDKAPELWD
jgi:hypothetical protein